MWRLLVVLAVLLFGGVDVAADGCTDEASFDVLVDEDGFEIYVDNDGYAVYVDEEGFVMPYVDEDGYAVYVDEEGYILDHMTDGSDQPHKGRGAEAHPHMRTHGHS